MAKVKFIDKSKFPSCWCCEGTGKTEGKKCKLCNGTGKFKEDNFHLIYTTKDGKKMAFQVDSLK